jgi:predicted HTH domain antitoxin
MSEAAFEVRIPTDLLKFGIDQNKIQQNVNEWLVFTLFTEGHVSSGKAATLLNISRVDFLTLLRKRGIAYIDYSPEELAEEFDTVNNLNLDSAS